MSVPRPILVHGSGGDHRVWRAAGGRLAGAVALDLPGHPAGEPHDDVAAIGAVLAEAIGALPPPRVLVGHSLGGAAALHAALARPGVADGLVLVATGARLPVPERVMEGLAADPAAERERLIAGFVTEAEGPGAAVARTTLEECSDATLRTDYLACRSHDVRGRLGGVRVPALVIAGEDDRLTPPWLQEELARELPLASMVVVPGARHMVMADAPATVAGLVAAFLARLELTMMDA